MGTWRMETAGSWASMDEVMRKIKTQYDFKEDDLL